MERRRFKWTQDLAILSVASLLWLGISALLSSVGFLFISNQAGRLEAWQNLPTITRLRFLGEWPISGIMIAATLILAFCLLRFIRGRAARYGVFATLILAIYLLLSIRLAPVIYSNPDARVWLSIIVSIFGGALISIWLSMRVVGLFSKT